MTHLQTETIKKTRRAVKKPSAEENLFLSLISFGLTVVVTRVFLEMAGYPQVGNSVLHIAHAIWGGLLLFVASLLPLILANRWAYTVSALLSGIGVGLFIDEVGKFITQKNDYFFAPAAPLIYSLFLLLVLVFLLLRRSRQSGPRASMYAAMLRLHEVLDDDLDPRERDAILAGLANGREAPEAHISLLAERLAGYLEDESIPLIPYQPGFWTRRSTQARAFGRRLGRTAHRRTLLVVLALISFVTLLRVFVMAMAWASPESRQALLPSLLYSAAELTVQQPVWLLVRLVLQMIVGLLCLLALVLLWRGREQTGVSVGLVASLLSLTTLQLLTFYVDQFQSLLGLFTSLAFFALLLAYRSWYLALSGKEADIP